MEHISSREFAEWMAFMRLEPFGEIRADVRHAALSALIANVNRDRKRKAQPYKPADFMLRFEGDEDEQEMLEDLPVEEQKQRIRAFLMASFGGFVDKTRAN